MTPRRWAGLRDDDAHITWPATRRHLLARWHATWRRLDNRRQDLRARHAGACNADTWTGEPPGGYAGGYPHWRCAREHGHPMPHRFNNSTWAGAGSRCEYDPLPTRNADNTTVLPFRALAEGRHLITTTRRARRIAAMVDDYHQKRRADAADETPPRPGPITSNGLLRAAHEIDVLRELLTVDTEPDDLSLCPCGGAIIYSMRAMSDVHATSRHRIDPPDDPHNHAGTGVTSEEMADQAEDLRARRINFPPGRHDWLHAYALRESVVDPS